MHRAGELHVRSEAGCIPLFAQDKDCLTDGCSPQQQKRRQQLDCGNGSEVPADVLKSKSAVCLTCQQGLFKAAEEDAYGPNFGGAKPAQVTVLTFGSPNVGNPEW